jgi:hypothetical protein
MACTWFEFLDLYIYFGSLADWRQCAKQTKNHRRRLSRQKTVGDWLSLDSAVFLRRRLSRRLSRFQAESKWYVGYCRK